MKKEIITIQPEERTDMTLPYPYFIDKKGFVGRQDFWKGKPLKLVGFSPINKQVFDNDQIDLSIFLKNPKRAIGMYPIFEHKDGEWHTYKDKIESVNKRIINKKA